MKNKILTIGGVVILGVIVIFVLVIIVPKLTQQTQTTSGVVTSTNTKDPLPNQELLTILQSVNTITLPDAVLRDPSFQSLVDISLSIQRSNTEGRVNPFAELSRGYTGATTGNTLIGGTTETSVPVVTP